MRYILQKRVRSTLIFGRTADPDRPYTWMQIMANDDKELLQDFMYKITDGEKRAEKNYRIIDTEARNGRANKNGR